uniref:Neuronal-specific septin-3 n=1 Tax=Takifugu rubripes TaxID=31033 RepID=A0A674PED1_TAKRU
RDRHHVRCLGATMRMRTASHRPSPSVAVVTEKGGSRQGGRGTQTLEAVAHRLGSDRITAWSDREQTQFFPSSPRADLRLINRTSVSVPDPPGATVAVGASMRPKPAVPAKPPNVGAPSPSNPFPPGIGALGGAAPLPPSGIPVPIGSHGPVVHMSSHSTGHGTGHGGSHAAAHTLAHNGGQGHGGSHGAGVGSALLGYIGIDTIIEQMRKKTMKTGFDFNIMVVGNSGLGKSTLVNTLFKSQVSRRSAGWTRDEKIPKTVEVKAVSHVLEEGGVKMKLTVIDTPGFGDQINNENCWEPISKYINEQYEKFLKEEVNITRKKRIPDTRVHCCLYFISPTGHSLRQLDVEFMKRLSHSVNIIPVIAKADTMTMEERQEFKQRVRKELEMGGIEFYPQKEFDEDMEDKSDNDKIREAMPFAVVGSDKEYQVNAKRVLGRKTAWGIVEVENPNHCEFAQLRDFLIRSHLQDLKEVTHNIHYETYRAKRLHENGGLHPVSCNDTQESNL